MSNWTVELVMAEDAYRHEHLSPRGRPIRRRRHRRRTRRTAATHSARLVRPAAGEPS